MRPLELVLHTRFFTLEDLKRLIGQIGFTSKSTFEIMTEEA
jgi:hypothetical protein